MLIMPYDTESKSRNASCVPFRGRGPRSGEGVCEGKNDYDTLILCLIALRSEGRRLAVRTVMEHPIGALPRTPFPASRDFPSRGNERYEGKTASHILQVPFRRFPPFGGWRHMNKPLCGLRVDGPSGRRFLRGLSLTAALPLRVVVGAYKL